MSSMLQARVATQPVLFAKVWQNPYVDVFRQLGVLEGKHAKVAGDVRVLLDPTLNKQVLCIKGAVSAANYLELPGPGTTSRERMRNPAAARTTSLGLTGEYVYLQLRAMADRYFVVHIDVQTVQGLVIRLSISNIFKFIKLMNHGRVLQLPCDFLSTKWSVLALHLPSLLEECSNNVQSMQSLPDSDNTGSAPPTPRKYVFHSIQRIQFCSSLYVRGVFTSPHRYSIGTFPKEARFFLARNASFDDMYEWFWIVTPPSKTEARAVHSRREEALEDMDEEAQRREEERQAAALEEAAREKDALRRAGDTQEISLARSQGAAPADSQQRLWDPTGRKPATPSKSSVPVQVFNGVDVTQSPHRAGPAAAAASADVSRRSSVAGAPLALAAPASSSSSADNRPLTTAEFEDHDQQQQQQQQRAGPSVISGIAPAPASLAGGVGALADPSVPTHSAVQQRLAQAFTQEDRKEYDDDDEHASARNVSQSQSRNQSSVQGQPNVIRHAAPSSSIVASTPSSSTAAAAALTATAAAASDSPLTPDPVLALDKIIGFTPNRSSANVCWSPCGQFMLYPSSTVLVIANVRTGAQEFLLGHTAPINLVQVSSNGIVATGQTGRSPLIRLWNFATRQCVAILMAHSSDLRCLCFSYMNLMLGAVGRDAQGRVLIVIWDISSVLETGAIHIVAKQLSDYGINSLLFSPFRDDPLHLISCGHESIRFWRIKTKHLPGSSLPLNEHARNTFTALAFECKYGEADATAKRMFVATASGSLFQINYATRQLECIYKLHSGPIYSLSINEGFCVTGSGDAFLRVWPLDFSDFFLQAQHKGAITSTAISADGLHVLVGAENGCIGVLDLSSTAYQTRMRAHLDTVYAVAFDPHRDEFATVSADGTIRVFGAHSLEQIYEFYSPHESVLCVAYHPLASEYRLACGFASGSMRIMDIATTSMHVDYAQHNGRVLDVLFAPDGGFLYSNGEDGNICAYDVLKNYLPVRMFTTYRNQPVPLPPTVLRSLHLEAERAEKAGMQARKLRADHDARMPFLSHHLDRARAEAQALDNPPPPAPHSHSHARHCGAGEGNVSASGPSGPLAHHSRDKSGPAPLPAHALAISADGSLLATIGADPSSIVLLSTETLRQVRLLSTQSLPVAKLLFAPLAHAHAAPELVAVLSDSSFQRFLLSDGTLLAHVSATPSMKFKQERALAAPSREVGLPFAAAGSVTVANGGATCTSAALSPLGLFLVTGSSDPLLRVWDAHSRPHAPHFQSLLAHASDLQPKEGVTGVTFAPGGKLVVSTGGDAVWLWRVLADEAAFIEQRARKQRRATDTRLALQASGRDQMEGNGRAPMPADDAPAPRLMYGVGHSSAPTPFRQQQHQQQAFPSAQASSSQADDLRVENI